MLDGGVPSTPQPLQLCQAVSNDCVIVTQVCHSVPDTGGNAFDTFQAQHFATQQDSCHNDSTNNVSHGTDKPRD